MTNKKNRGFEQQYKPTCPKRHILKTPLTSSSNTHSSQAPREHFAGSDHVLDHKTTLDKAKNTEIIPSIFSNHNGIELEINNGMKAGKFINTYKLNNTFLNNQ